MPLKPVYMSAIKIKAEIQSYLEQVKDESFLKVVHSMLNTYIKEQEDSIIGYDIDGQPKRAGEMQRLYDDEVRAAREGGTFTTLEALEKEMEAW